VTITSLDHRKNSLEQFIWRCDPDAGVTGLTVVGFQVDLDRDKREESTSPDMSATILSAERENLVSSGLGKIKHRIVSGQNLRLPPSLTKDRDFAPKIEIFTRGIDIFTRGIDIFTRGIEIFTRGIEIFTRGIDIFTGGIDIFTRGIDIFTHGIDFFTRGIDIFTGGVEIFTARIEIFTKIMDDLTPKLTLSSAGWALRTRKLSLSILYRRQNPLEQFISAAVLMPAPHDHEIVFRIDPDCA
jgi:hypothetical protein